MTVYNSNVIEHITRQSQQEHTVESGRCNAHRGIPVFIQQSTAVIALLLLSPILLICALLIRLESKGAPIFSQVRVGQNGRRFKFYKFRSMYTPQDKRWVDISKMQSDRDGVCKKFKQDPRITPIGKIIRKLSIDELPQLFNVAKGDMVLIGPRPALCSETDAYDATAMDRLDALPGITGLWQVSGRADTTFEEQIELDNRYIQKQSFWFDFKILLETIPAVLTSRGAY